MNRNDKNKFDRNKIRWKTFYTKHVHYRELNIYIQSIVSVNEASWPTVRLRYIEEAQPHNKDMDKPNWLSRYNKHCKQFNIWSNQTVVEAIYIEMCFHQPRDGEAISKKSNRILFFAKNSFLRFAKYNYPHHPLNINCIQRKWYLSNEQNKRTIWMF